MVLFCGHFFKALFVSKKKKQKKMKKKFGTDLCKNKEVWFNVMSHDMSHYHAHVL
jgi:hypothetical protein